MDKAYVVGVDVGGTTAKIGIVNRRGEILAKKSIDSRYGKGEADKFMDALCSTISELAAGVGIENVNGIGVGAPDGNYYKGTIEDASNLLWAKGITVDFAIGIKKRLNGIKCVITNDANAAAMGEMAYGAAKGMKDFIMITLGTGVGSGIVIDGKIVYGHDGFAGELGHTCAVRDGRMCGCGKRGCLEAYTSATGVARTAKEWLDKSKEESLLRGCSLSGNGKEITSKDVFDAAEKGDELAKEIFEYTGKILGEKLADFVEFSAPEAIILFGGLSHAHKYIMNPLQKAMNENLISLWRGKVPVMLSALKESDAAILGASALAW